jgi:hypothetical protein
MYDEDGVNVVPGCMLPDVLNLDQQEARPARYEFDPAEWLQKRRSYE